MGRKKKRQAQTAPAAEARPHLSRKQKALLVGFGLALLFLAEGFLRVTGIAPPYRPRDPLLHGGQGERAYRPGTLPSGDGGYLCTWIRPEFPFNFQPIPAVKPTEEVRIFTFGESACVGYPYDGRLAFSSFLQAGLDAVLPQRRVRVINAGQNAIDTGTVLRLMQEMTNYQPDVFVVYTGNNEYSGDHIYRRVRRLGRTVAALQSTAGHLALYRAMSRVLLPAKARLYASFLVSDEGVEAEPYSPAERQLIEDNFAYCIQSMVDLCAERGIRLVLCTVATNYADWPPYRAAFSPKTPPERREQWLRQFKEAWAAFQDGRNAETLKRLDELAAIDDARADLHFLRGQALAKAGSFTEAWESFVRALDLDLVPHRARPSQNAIVRRAAARARAPLVDTVAALRKESKDGLVGENFFSEHCHPNPEAHRTIALSIAEELFRSGILPAPPNADWRQPFRQAGEQWQRAQVLTPSVQARAWRNIASGWMGQWTDHRNPDDVLRADPKYLRRAQEYLDRAIAADANAPGAHFYRGVIHAQLGEKDKALADWRAERALGSADGPRREVLDALIGGEQSPDRGFAEWLFIRNEMMR